MARRKKPGTKAVANIDPEVRAEVMRLTGAKTFTEAIHEAPAGVILRKQAEAPLLKRRAMERQWIAEKGLGLPRHAEYSPHLAERAKSNG